MKLIDLLNVMDQNENLVICGTQETIPISDLTSKKQTKKLLKENWTDRQVKNIHLDEYNGYTVIHIIVEK